MASRTHSMRHRERVRGRRWYEFDARPPGICWAEAGVGEGFETTIYFRAEARVYLPEPTAVANELAQQLSENLGWNVSAQVVESGEFIKTATADVGYPLYMLGWGADYPHITNFLDFHFGEANPQFGTAHPEIYEPLVEASAIADPAEAAPLYEQANNAIKELVPAVPSHTQRRRCNHHQPGGRRQSQLRRTPVPVHEPGARTPSYMSRQASRSACIAQTRPTVSRSPPASRLSSPSWVTTSRGT